MSVVIIAFAVFFDASLEFLALSIKGLMFFKIGSIGRGTPITPVEATATSFSLIFKYSATDLHIAFAFSIPSLLQVFAFPELHIIAFAFPFFKFSLLTIILAPQTLF